MSRHRHHASTPDGATAQAARPAPCEDRSWAARSHALQFDKSAQGALGLAMAALLVATVSWVVVLIPGPGDARASPLFWLLAAPLMVFSAGVQPVSRWGAYVVWAVLLASPLAAAGALLVARGEAAPRLATPIAMDIVLALCTASAVGGIVFLRRSSLPGGRRPPRFLAPGRLPPGARHVSWPLVDALQVASLALSGALINGIFFCVLLSEAFTASLWPIPVAGFCILLTGYLMIRGGRGLTHDRPAAAPLFHRGVWAGAGSAALFWLVVLAWSYPLGLKLLMSIFMGPAAIGAAWGAHRSWRQVVELGDDGTPALTRLD